MISSSLSDHEMVYCIRKLNWKRAPAQIKTFRNYVNYDANNFCNDLNDVNLTPENIPDEDLCDQPVNDLWNTFKLAFVSVAENHAPVNKGGFRSRPISAFVYIFALSQSECVKRFIT